MRATKGLFERPQSHHGPTALTVVTSSCCSASFDPDTAGTWFYRGQDTIIAGFKWYYILVVALFLFFAVYLMFSRFGSIRLGDDDQVPSLATLPGSPCCSAQAGIGLVFWSIAEPMYHLQGNLHHRRHDAGSGPESPCAPPSSTGVCTPWAIYDVGLSLAFFSYRRKLPLAIRSVLYPILGDRIYGFWGHAADVLAVFGTVFGWQPLGAESPR